MKTEGADNLPKSTNRSLFRKQTAAGGNREGARPAFKDIIRYWWTTTSRQLLIWRLLDICEIYEGISYTQINLGAILELPGKTKTKPSKSIKSDPKQRSAWACFVSPYVRTKSWGGRESCVIIFWGRRNCICVLGWWIIWRIVTFMIYTVNEMLNHWHP